MSAHILVEQLGPIVKITMNRPEKKNAITLAMYDAMTAALTEAAATSTSRVILLAGHASIFSSGNDIADFMAAANGGDIAAPLRFLRALAALNKPVVAAVHGPAIGIGTTMLLHCDFIYAAADARFKTPFVDLALVPEAASSLILPTLVGQRRAAQLLQLGAELSAETALDWGLITAVANGSETPEALAMQTAQTLASRAPSALQATKALCHRHDRDAILQTIDIEGEQFLARLKSPEASEAFAAFMQRRTPDFSKF